MKKTFLLTIAAASLLVTGCNNQGGSTATTVVPGTSSTVEPTTSPSVPTSATTSQTSTPTSATTSQTSTGTSAVTSSSEIKPAGSGIKEANEKGEALKGNVPSGKHEYFSEEIVTIKGRVIQEINIGLSMQVITILTDGIYTIEVLHAGGDNFAKAYKGYIGKDTSNYTITGKIGYYYSKPCMTLTSYNLDQSMKFNVDYKTWTYSEYDSIESYNAYCESVDYNKKGHGIGDLVLLKGLKCIAKADDNSWLFSDGTYVQGIYHQTSNTHYTIGKYYDVYGIANVYQWKPSLRTLTTEYRNELSFDVDIKSNAVAKTSTEMYRIGAPIDDTEKSTATNRFLKTFKYFYKSENQYFNAYTVDANYYVVSSETKYEQGGVTSQNSAADKNMFKFNNAGFKYNSQAGFDHLAVRDYMYQDIPLTMYFCAYQYTTANKKEMPQVYLFENYVPKLSFPDTELMTFFAGQTYLITEGQIPMPEFENCIWYSQTVSGVFYAEAIGVTSEEFSELILDLDFNYPIVYDASKSSGNHRVYRHDVTNPKFYYGVQYDDFDTLKIDIQKA